MPRVRSLPLFLLTLPLLWVGCQSQAPSPAPDDEVPSPGVLAQRYATVRLDADLSALSGDQQEMVSLFIEAAQAMDAVFWEQAYGNRDSLLQAISNPQRRRYAGLNYGPWDRLRGGEPFVEGAGPRPPGANFYPSGLTAAALRKAASADASITAPHTMVRRLPDGRLTALPYHLFFAESMTTAAGRLKEAAQFAPSPALRQSLERRATALMTGDHSPDGLSTPDGDAVDLVIGPMQTGEDRLLGVKRAAAALVLRRNPDRSRRLDRLARRLPALWNELAVPDRLVPAPPDGYAARAYDALYVAGGVNAGPKPTALPLPRAQRAVGTEARPLLIPNTLRARADTLLRPLARKEIVASQRPHVTADALFDVAALRQAARRTLPDTASSLRAAGAAEAIGLSLAGGLVEEGEADSLDYYVTGLTHLLHAVRIDSTRAGGRAALASFNYLRGQGAVTRDAEAGRYAVVPDTMARALPTLARAWLRRSGDDAEAFAEQYGEVSAPLRSTLARLDSAGVPRALAFEQGPSVLRGLSPATAAR